MDYFTASEEPEIVTVDDDGSNDEPDEDEEIKATPVSEDAEDEDDDLPDEYWIVKEETKMKEIERFDELIDQQKAEITEREQKIASAEAEIAANDAEIARITFQNESETDKFEKRSNEVEIARLNATNEYLRRDIEEYRGAIKMYEGYIASTEAKKAEYIKVLKAAQLATTTESESTTAEIEESAPAKEENEMTTTIITDAELTTKAAVAIDEAPTSEKATIRYIPCKGFSVNGDIFTSFKRGIEDWLENVICYDARAQLLVATRKQLIGIDGKPVRGNYSADRIIVKFNFDSHNDFRGDVKGDNHSIKVAPNEEYFDPEYEAQCKEIVTNWLDKNAGEYRKYQMRMEAKRRADKYYTENPDWNHNGNRVPNSQREAIREYLEQLHAADKTETTDKKESDAVNSTAKPQSLHSAVCWLPR